MSVVTSPANLNFSQGKLKKIYKEAGTWKLEKDSLIINPGSIDFEVDASKMTVQPENQEMLDRWVQNYEKECLATYQKGNKDLYWRVWGARLDASRDKLELKKGGNTSYFKREKGGVKR